MSLSAWLQRLSFSFFIIAFAVFWHGQKQVRAGNEAAGTLWIAAAVGCVVLGATGVRLRHQRPQR